MVYLQRRTEPHGHVRSQARRPRRSIAASFSRSAQASPAHGHLRATCHSRYPSPTSSPSSAACGFPSKWGTRRRSSTPVASTATGRRSVRWSAKLRRDAGVIDCFAYIRGAGGRQTHVGCPDFLGMSTRPAIRPEIRGSTRSSLPRGVAGPARRSPVADALSFDKMRARSRRRLAAWSPPSMRSRRTPRDGDDQQGPATPSTSSESRRRCARSTATASQVSAGGGWPRRAFQSSPDAEQPRHSRPSATASGTITITSSSTADRSPAPTRPARNTAAPPPTSSERGLDRRCRRRRPGARWIERRALGHAEQLAPPAARPLAQSGFAALMAGGGLQGPGQVIGATDPCGQNPRGIRLHAAERAGDPVWRPPASIRAKLHTARTIRAARCTLLDDRRPVAELV